jgi:5-bromo-4-chloroindolyl phosphate hydrolysis protein
MPYQVNPVFLDPEVQSALRDRDQEIARLRFNLSIALRNLREIERVLAKIDAETCNPSNNKGIRLVHELVQIIRHTDLES